MHNGTHVFDFWFAAPNKEKRTRPQLVFTLDKKFLPELTKRLYTLSSRWTMDGYLGSSCTFSLPTPDLFGNIDLGYGRCGKVTEEGEEVSLRLELSKENLYHVTATIHHLATALSIPFESSSSPSNRPQQVEFMTVCDNKSSFYGHAVSGYISGEVRHWLRLKSADLDRDLWFTEAPWEISAAMRQAWKAVVPKKARRWATECNARIGTDGRFIFECMGNACDLAIYPDSTYPGQGDSAFSCHNLDQARQQVTLLAGLAKLCELVRQNQ